MENNQNPRIKCKYCRVWFRPEPVFIGKGRKRMVQIECPRCGNGDTITYGKLVYLMGRLNRGQ